MIDPVQLRHEVIAPALKDIGLWSQAAENLCMGTALQESVSENGAVQYLKQLGKGPALGIFQMEPETHIWLKDWLARKKPETLGKIHKLAVGMTDAELLWNLKYAAAMCRIRYLVAPGALPAADDIDGLAAYYKKNYNTPAGAATASAWAAKYRKYAQ